MTLDTTEVLTITESALEPGVPLGALAGRIAGVAESRNLIVIVSASRGEQAAMDRRAAGLGLSGDAFTRANLVTLPARENAQRLSGLLTMIGVESSLLEPAVFTPITRGSPLESEPRLLHAKRYEQAVREARVLVLAGGVGRTPDGHLTSLGSGGATLSGLFVAQRLGLPLTLVIGGNSGAGEDTLPKRALLFARRHGVEYRTVTQDEITQTHEPEMTGV